MVAAARAPGADLDFIAVNDLTDTATLAHLLKYDSVLGPLGEDVQVADGLPPVVADKDRARQVLVNLVDNGIKYTGMPAWAARRRDRYPA